MMVTVGFGPSIEGGLGIEIALDVNRMGTLYG
jgi:hypothetical protein